MKDTFDGFIRRDITEKRISELEGMSMEALQMQ